MRPRFVLAIACMILCAFTVCNNHVDAKDNYNPQKPSINLVAESPRALAWADSVMGKMTLEQRVAQLFVPRLDITDNPAGKTAIKKMVADHKVGGFLLGKGTIESYSSLINAAQGAADIPLLVTLDGEWGLSMRITDAPRFPYNMGLGAIRDTKLLEEYGNEVARECRAIGINVNFAPDVDVNSNPANPVIGYRSFGENPQRVAAAGSAYGKGLENGNVLAVAKHFPGHGDTSTDSHKTLPIVNHSREKMEDVDLLPFHQFIKSDLGGVMVGHLKVPSLDASGQPASLSPKITTNLLKRQMGFKGLVFTDALAMKGAVSSQNNCVTAFKAGADILLGSSSPTTDILAMTTAVKHGDIKREEIDNRCRKVLAYKYALGLSERPKAINASTAKSQINSTKAADIASRLAAASITIIQDNASLLPISELATKSIAIVSLGAAPENLFSETCRKYANCKLFSINKQEITPSQLSKIKEFDIIVTAVFNDSEWARQSFSQLSTHRDMIGVFFINPYKMAKFGAGIKDIGALVTAYDDTPELRKAAAIGIFGGEKVDGQFPVNLTGIAKVGDGRQTKKVRLGYAKPHDEGFGQNLETEVDSIMRQSLSAGAFPGAQLLIARNGNIVYDKCFGYTDASKRNAVTDTTLYDLASVTKATGTLAGLMKAYEDEMFRLDNRVSATIPELKETDKADLTYSDLLFHESGLPAGISPQKFATEKIDGSRQTQLRADLVQTHKSDEFDMEMAKGLFVGIATRDSLLHKIYNAKLRPNKTYLYSDLNFCLLMEAEERMTGVDHDQWVATEVFEPLGAYHLTYNPLSHFSEAQIAPTENDREFRKQLIHGYVHDETAALSGGVQGNAGLFGTTNDLAKLCQMWLNGGTYGGTRILWPETIKKFTNSRSKSKTRALGFDLQPSNSPAPAATYGHNGFTGTCFWVDPKNDIIYIFLSNRINPSRTNEAFSRLKPRTAVLESIYRNLNNAE